VSSEARPSLYARSSQGQLPPGLTTIDAWALVKTLLTHDLSADVKTKEKSNIRKITDKIIDYRAQ